MLLDLFRNLLFRSFTKSIIEDDVLQNDTGSAIATTDDDQGSKDNAGDGEETIVIKGKEYKASDLIGSDGIPRAKNLSIELDRKNRELDESKNLLKGIVQQAPQPPQVDPQKQFDGIVSAVKSKYPNIDDEQVKAIVEVSQGMVQAQQIARAPIDAEYFIDRAKSSVLRQNDNEEEGISDKSVLNKWEDEVNEALSAMPLAWKSSPGNANQAVKNAIDVVKGRHVKDIIADAKKGLDERGGIRPRDTSVVSSGGAKAPKGMANNGAGLTEAQKIDKDRMRNVSDSDYKILLKKAQERDKAAAKQPRHTLN